MSETRSKLKKLEREGWERKFIACEPRLNEAVETYKQAGFEVHLEPIPEESECKTCTGEEDSKEKECRVCFEGLEDMYRIIYVRPIKEF